MKKNIRLMIALITFGVIMWQCNQNDAYVSNLSTKGTFQTNSQKLNTAVNAISATDGYQVLSVDDSELKSATTDNEWYHADSIELADISGVYEFNPSPRSFRCHRCSYRLFSKTDDSDQLIIKLPDESAFHPWRLRYVDPQDTSMSNNFVITATDYHYYFQYGMMYDYGLSASFNKDSVNIGQLDVQSNRTGYHNYMYSSAYHFDNNYSVNFSSESGDTAKYSFSLMDGSDVLLKEMTTYIYPTDSTDREKTYSLQIGDIEIVRTSGSDSIEVYQNGELQQDVTAEFIDQSSDSSMHSICHQRDIQITFADSTTTTVSELISPSKEILAGLMESMKSNNFSKHLIDYVAWNIYKNEND